MEDRWELEEQCRIIDVEVNSSTFHVSDQSKQSYFKTVRWFTYTRFTYCHCFPRGSKSQERHQHDNVSTSLHHRRTRSAAKQKWEGLVTLPDLCTYLCLTLYVLILSCKKMANRTQKDAKSIKGTNPQYLVEKIIRTRIYDSKYWKEQCFGLSCEYTAHAQLPDLTR